MKNDEKKMSLRLLLADDEEIARQSLRAQCETLGHTVVAEAGDGRQAVALAEETKPDLALLDIRMPEMDGIEAGREIIEMTNTPVMLITAYSDEDVIQRAADAGAFYFLTKPIRMSDLEPGMAMAVARFRDMRQLHKRLEARTLVSRAKGILMDKMKMTEDEAHKKIHFLARNQNKTMAEVSQFIIENKRLPDD